MALLESVADPHGLSCTSAETRSRLARVHIRGLSALQTQPESRVSLAVSLPPSPLSTNAKRRLNSCARACFDREIIRRGSFDGGFFRPVKVRVSLTL